MCKPSLFPPSIRSQTTALTAGTLQRQQVLFNYFSYKVFMWFSQHSPKQLKGIPFLLLYCSTSSPSCPSLVPHTCWYGCFGSNQGINPERTIQTSHCLIQFNACSQKQLKDKVNKASNKQNEQKYKETLLLNSTCGKATKILTDIPRNPYI